MNVTSTGSGCAVVEYCSHLIDVHAVGFIWECFAFTWLHFNAGVTVLILKKETFSYLDCTCNLS
jgi:hypothetical protein